MPGVRPLQSDRTWCLSSGSERLQNQDSNCERTFIWEIKEVKEVIFRKKNGLRKLLTEVEEGPLELRHEGVMVMRLREGQEGREREKQAGGFSVLRT